MRLPFLWVLALLVGIAVPATAQEFSWQQIDGRLVLTNRRSPQAAIAPSRSRPNGAPLATRKPRVSPNAMWYDGLITEHARNNGIRESLVRAVVQVESAFNPYARSPKGALGLMQLMPATIERFAVANPFNPTDNVRAGAAYLRELLDRYDNNERLALAAYNAGPGAVDRHGQTVPPYVETQNYVSRVSEIAAPAATAAPAGTRIYRVTEIIDGREVVRYMDHQPR